MHISDSEYSDIVIQRLLNFDGLNRVIIIMSVLLIAQNDRQLNIDKTWSHCSNSIRRLVDGLSEGRTHLLE